MSTSLAHHTHFWPFKERKDASRVNRRKLNLEATENREDVEWRSEGRLAILPSGPLEGLKTAAGAGASGSFPGVGAGAESGIKKLTRGMSKGEGARTGAGVCFRGLEAGTLPRREGSGTGAGAAPELGERGNAGWGAATVPGEVAGGRPGAVSLGEGPRAGVIPGDIWGALGVVAGGTSNARSLGEGPGVGVSSLRQLDTENGRYDLQINQPRHARIESAWYIFGFIYALLIFLFLLLLLLPLSQEEFYEQADRAGLFIFSRSVLDLHHTTLHHTTL
jgi:hypothetical protein